MKAIILDPLRNILQYRVRRDNEPSNKHNIKPAHHEKVLGGPHTNGGTRNPGCSEAPCFRLPQGSPHGIDQGTLACILCTHLRNATEHVSMAQRGA